jgi:hypothetical protein
MGTLWLRGLVVLLSLALAGGNAHAELRLGSPPAHHQPCSEAQGHAHGDTSDDRRDGGDHAGCCCDCLGCIPAVHLSVDLNSLGPALYGAVIRFLGEPHSLPERDFPPELGPPRPFALN